NLFVMPAKFNKEQLELFCASFIQNTQACMQALEKGGAPAQIRDMENKLFASLLWALTFGSIVDQSLKAEVEAIWRELVKYQSELKASLDVVINELKLEENKLTLMRKAATMSVDEMLPLMD